MTNVPRLHDVFPQGMGFVLVFEFMVSDLSEVIKDADNPLRPEEVKGYMLMLLRGVAFLHGREVMHRDLKPANLLISADGRLKIADFGLSRICRKGEERQYSHQVRTSLPPSPVRWPPGGTAPLSCSTDLGSTRKEWTSGLSAASSGSSSTTARYFQERMTSTSWG